MKNQSRRNAGFTLVEIMIVVSIIGLLAAIAVPNFIRARISSQQSACVNNLRMIDAAKHQWALETGAANSLVAAPSVLAPYIGRGAGSVASVICPMDPSRTMATSYAVGDLSTAPACRILPTTHIIH